MNGIASIQNALCIIDQIRRNGVWGTCSGCPHRSRMAMPEECAFFDRYDHKIDAQAGIEKASGYLHAALRSIGGDR